MRRHEPSRAFAADDDYSKTAKPHGAVLQNLGHGIAQTVSGFCAVFAMVMLAVLVPCFIGFGISAAYHHFHRPHGLEEVWPNNWGHLDLSDGDEGGYALVIYNESQATHLAFLKDIEAASKQAQVRVKVLDCEAHDVHVCEPGSLMIGDSHHVKEPDWDEDEPAAVFQKTMTTTDSYHAELKASKGIHSVSARPDAGRDRIEALTQWLKDAMARGDERANTRFKQNSARYNPYRPSPDLSDDPLANFNDEDMKKYSEEDDGFRKYKDLYKEHLAGDELPDGASTEANTLNAFEEHAQNGAS